MSLLDYSIQEVIIVSFALDVWQRMGSSILETLYMMAPSFTIVLFYGLLLGILLTVTNPDGLMPLKPLYASSG